MSMLKHRNAIVESSSGDSAIVATALCWGETPVDPRPVFAKLRPGRQGEGLLRWEGATPCLRQVKIS